MQTSDPDHTRDHCHCHCHTIGTTGATCFLFQEFGDVNTNNLGHTVTMAVHPLTKRKVQAVFMPKKPEGVWTGEIVQSSMVHAETVIDDDVSALRKNQLCLDRTGHVPVRQMTDGCNRCDVSESDFVLLYTVCEYLLKPATATEGNQFGAGLSAPAVRRVSFNQ